MGILRLYDLPSGIERHVYGMTVLWNSPDLSDQVLPWQAMLNCLAAGHAIGALCGGEAFDIHGWQDELDAPFEEVSVDVYSGDVLDAPFGSIPPRYYWDVTPSLLRSIVSSAVLPANALLLLLDPPPPKVVTARLRPRTPTRDIVTLEKSLLRGCYAIAAVGRDAWYLRWLATPRGRLLDLERCVEAADQAILANSWYCANRSLISWDQDALVYDFEPDHPLA